MNKKGEILDSVQRLNRNIKRYNDFSNQGPHGRGQGKTLKLIEEHDGIRATELAALLDIRPSSLTQKLDKLESDGNIARERDRKDARVVRIFITDEGRRILERKDHTRNDLSKDFSECLSKEEKVSFCNLCNRLSDSLEALKEEQKLLHSKVLFLNKEKPEIVEKIIKNDDFA